MNCNEINEFSIVEYLRIKNIHPSKSRNHDHFYFSPFREERTPSFKVNSNINRYYDFGEGKGGSLIDLIKRIENLSIKEIIHQFSNNSLVFKKHYYVKKIKENPTKRIKILECKPVYSYVLKSYLKARGIVSKKSYQYLEEVVFKIDNWKSQFALGFKNKDGNYELRNSIFKGSTGKNLSEIFLNRPDNRVFVFEGFFDFLSFLELNQYPESNYIIMNSVANFERLIQRLKVENFSEIHLYLDNDEAGDNCTVKLLAQFQNMIIDHRIEYKYCNDLNDFLIAKSILK